MDTILITIAEIVTGWISLDLLSIFVTKRSTIWLYTIAGGYIGGVIAYYNCIPIPV